MATTTTRLERVINAINQRLAENNGMFADLTMKVNGDKVGIDTMYCPKGMYSVYFNAIGTCETAHTIEELATWLIEYPKKVDEIIKAEEDYVAENEPKIRQYFKEHFEGKAWEDINKDDWGWYSDWHKDVFGYRPHDIVCGVYVSPY